MRDARRDSHGWWASGSSPGDLESLGGLVLLGLLGALVVLGAAGVMAWALIVGGV